MNKKIKLILFFIVFIIGIFMIPTLGQASSNVKSILQIDTNLNNAVFDKTGIHIEGWKLADISNTKLKVYIDGKEVSAEKKFTATSNSETVELEFEFDGSNRKRIWNI